jgi:hypothetical protein
MASQKAPFRIPASIGKKAWPLVSVFPGDHRESWSKWGGSKNNFRIQFGEKFYTRKGEKRSFLSAGEVGQVLAERMAKVFKVPVGNTPKGTVTLNLFLPQGARVWYREGGMLPMAEMIGAPPFERDGEWFVVLSYSKKAVPLSTVKPRTESLAECSIEPEECLEGYNGD